MDVYPDELVDLDDQLEVDESTQEIKIEDMTFRQRQAYFRKLSKLVNFIPIPKKAHGVWFKLKTIGTATHILMCSVDPDTHKTAEISTGYSWKK